MPHPCPKGCGYEAATPYNLQEHLDRKNPCDAGTYKCSQPGCGRTFLSRRSLVRHAGQCAPNREAVLEAEVARLRAAVDNESAQDEVAAGAVQTADTAPAGGAAGDAVTVQVPSEPVATRLDGVSPAGSVYLVHHRVSIEAREPVYKLGYTTDSMAKRLRAYTKGSRQIFAVAVHNPRDVEALLMPQFQLRYTQRLDLGSEYFQGDVCDMMQTLLATAVRFA